MDVATERNFFFNSVQFPFRSCTLSNYLHLSVTRLAPALTASASTSKLLLLLPLTPYVHLLC